MRFNIKARLAQLGKKSKDMVEELEKYGIEVFTSDFSAAINGKLHTPKAERAVEVADKILTGWETAAKGK